MLAMSSATRPSFGFLIVVVLLRGRSSFGGSRQLTFHKASLIWAPCVQSCIQLFLVARTTQLDVCGSASMKPLVEKPGGVARLVRATSVSCRRPPPTHRRQRSFITAAPLTPLFCRCSTVSRVIDGLRAAKTNHRDFRPSRHSTTSPYDLSST